MLNHFLQAPLITPLPVLEVSAGCAGVPYLPGCRIFSNPHLPPPTTHTFRRDTTQHQTGTTTISSTGQYISFLNLSHYYPLLPFNLILHSACFRGSLTDSLSASAVGDIPSQNITVQRHHQRQARYLPSQSRLGLIVGRDDVFIGASSDSPAYCLMIRRLSISRLCLGTFHVGAQMSSFMLPSQLSCAMRLDPVEIGKHE